MAVGATLYMNMICTSVPSRLPSLVVITVGGGIAFTLQPGTSAPRWCRNSRADAKVVIYSPTDRRNHGSTSRLEASSSTTKIIASPALMPPSRHGARAVEHAGDGPRPGPRLGERRDAMPPPDLTRDKG